MSEGMNKPEIRFKGFEGEWKALPLGEVSEKVISKNSNKQYQMVFTNSAELGIIDQKEYFERNIVNIDNIDGYYIVLPNDFVYNPRISTTAPVGPINRNKNEYIGVMSPLYYVFRLKSDKLDYSYMDFFFKSSVWHSFMFKNGNNGARSDRFSISDSTFVKLPIQHPTNIEEQKKIGDLFNALDSLIHNLELKLEKLRHIKQSLLDLMFVDVENEGQMQPRIRFRGFEDEWEKNILNYYLTVSSEKNQSNNYNKYDIYSVSREYGVINQIEYQGKSFAGASLINYGVVKMGDVVYTKSPLKNQPYGIIKTSALTTGIVSALYGVFHPLDTINSPFVHIYFELDRRLNNYLRPLVNKGAKNTLLISDEDSIKGNVIFPNKNEQGRIIVLFGQIDMLIREQEVKLEKSRNIKQSLLQKMFV